MVWDINRGHIVNASRPRVKAAICRLLQRRAGWRIRLTARVCSPVTGSRLLQSSWRRGSSGINSEGVASIPHSTDRGADATPSELMSAVLTRPQGSPPDCADNPGLSDAIPSGWGWLPDARSRAWEALMKYETWVTSVPVEMPRSNWKLSRVPFVRRLQRVRSLPGSILSRQNTRLQERDSPP